MWFISETVDQLNIKRILAKYESDGSGNLPYHPAMMLMLLIYAYATGEFGLVCRALNLRRMGRMIHWA